MLSSGYSKIKKTTHKLWPVTISGLLVLGTLSVFTFSSSTISNLSSSADASISVSAGKISTSYMNNGQFANTPDRSTQHFFVKNVPVNDGYSVGDQNTITNTGNLDQEVRLISDPIVFDQSEILDQTQARVVCEGNVIYSGPLKSMETSPIRLSPGESKTYTIELALTYDQSLDKHQATIFTFSTPIRIISNSPGVTPNEGFNQTINASIMYRMSPWQMQLSHVSFYPEAWNYKCATFYWMTWNSAKYSRFIFQYSEKPDMSNPIEISTKNVTLYLGSLKKSTVYYYRIKVEGTFNPKWSDIGTFTSGSFDATLHEYWQYCEDWPELN